MKTIATAIILLSFNYLNAQESNFTILEKGSKYSSERIVSAMNGADWCGFYFQNENHVITFDDGSVVEFKSASELLNVDASCVSEPFIDKKVYEIHPSGRILIQVDKMERLKTSVTK